MICEREWPKGTGSRVPPSSCVKLYHWAQFVVVESMPTSCLIGMDFLLRHRCIVNCINCRLDIRSPGGVTVPLGVDKNILRVCRVSLTKQVTVQGCQ